MPFDLGYSSSLITLIKRMLSKSPLDRPTVTEIASMNLLEVNSAEVKLMMPNHIGKSSPSTVNKLAQTGRTIFYERTQTIDIVLEESSDDISGFND